MPLTNSLAALASVASSMKQVAVRLGLGEGIADFLVLDESTAHPEYFSP